MSMRLIAARIAMICLAGGIGCTNQPKPPVVDATGMTHYSTSRTKQSISCEGQPIQLEGDRTDLTLRGRCTYVRITGSHNDIETDIVPGGTIEITGGHNDVTWRQIESGPPPQLQNRGESNTFHRAENT
jgi:hypothetical protein